MQPDPPGGWRVLFLGQGPLAEFAYERLLDLPEEAGLRVLVACSNPSPEGTWWGTSWIRDHAPAHSIPFVSNAERNDSLLAEAAAQFSVNCLISVGHPWVVHEEVLRAVVGPAAFNLHKGPLPRFGGFNTGSHAILEGSTHFGATLHWMEPKPDAGPIAFEERFEVPEDATARSLHELTVRAGRHLFSRFVDTLLEGQLPPRVPLSRAPTIYPRRALADLREIVDLSDEVEVDRKSRAFWFPPFEPAFYRYKGKKYYVVPSQGFTDVSKAD